MTIAIIQRKFAPPALPAPHVPRRALLERLSEGLAPRRKLTVVRGGPGTGKTALLAEYAAAVPALDCWYGLGPGDGDPAVFCRHVVACLARRMPELAGRAFSALDALGRPDYGQAMALLCDDLSMVLEAPLVLVLEDSQHLGDQPEVAAALEVLVRYFPDDSQVILSGRAMPPLKLAREQAMGQVLALGEEDLAFCEPEIDLLLAASGNARTTASEIMERTGGWAIGTAHLANPAHVPGATAGPAASRIGTPALLSAYLSEEILDPQDARFRDDLLTASFLPVLTADSCTPVLGDRAEAFLARLGSFGPFAAGTADGVTLQPIFREFLQREFALRKSPAAQADAFRALAGCAIREQAVSFLVRAGDLEAAERLLLQGCGELAATGRHSTLAALLAEFPAERLAKSSALAYVQGEAARQGGRLAEAVRMLEQAADLQGSRDPALHGRILAALAAAHGARGSLDVQEAYGARALRETPPEDLATLALAHNALGLAAAARLDLEAALDRFDRAVDLYRRLADRAGEIRVLHNRGLVHAKGGDFERAIAAYGEAVRQASAASVAPLPLTYNNLALCHLHLGRSREAWTAFERGMALADELNAPRDRVMLLRTLGQLHLHDGDGERARSAFEASLAEATDLGDPGAAALAHFGLAEEALQRGDLPRARALLGQGLEIADHPRGTPAAMEAALLAVRLEIDAGDGGRAAELLDGIAGELAAGKNDFQRFVAAVYRHRSAGARGDAAAQGDALAAARELAGRHGYPLPTELGHPAQDGAPALPPPPTVDVSCLGAFDVRVEGKDLGTRHWRSVNAKLVLVYLLLNPQGATRERLLELLYPSGEVARSALAMVVSRLRQALEPEAQKGAPSRFILFQDGRYFFSRGVRVRLDVLELRSLVAQAREPRQEAARRREILETAVGLYRGTFMEEFPDLPWCQVERENVRRVAIEAWEELFAALAAEDAWPAVEQAAEACLAVDPAAQTAHRAKLIALAMQERPADALRYDTAASAALRADLGLDPDPETRDLADLIRDGRFTVRAAREFLPTRW